MGKYNVTPNELQIVVLSKKTRDVDEKLLVYRFQNKNVDLVNSFTAKPGLSSMSLVLECHSRPLTRDGNPR